MQLLDQQSICCDATQRANGSRFFTMDVACPSCTYVNDGSSATCSICDTLLVRAATVDAGVGLACRICTFQNPPHVGICMSCGQRTATLAEVTAAARAAEPGTLYSL